MTTPDDTAHPSAPDAFERALCRILARAAEQLALDGHADAAREALELGLRRGWLRAVASDAGLDRARAMTEGDDAAA